MQLADPRRRDGAALIDRLIHGATREVASREGKSRLYAEESGCWGRRANKRAWPDQSLVEGDNRWPQNVGVGGNTGGIGLGGILVIVGIVLLIVWSFWVGLIVALIGLIAFGG